MVYLQKKQIMNLILFFSIVLLYVFILFYVKHFFATPKSKYTVSYSQRALALFIDKFVIWLLVLVYFIYGYFRNPAFRSFVGESVNDSFHNGTNAFQWMIFKTDLYVSIVFLFISFVSELIFKTTIGKKTVGLKLVSNKGEISVLQILIRNLIKPISFFLWPFALLFVPFTPSRKWFHEIVSNSSVEIIEN